MPGEIDHVDVSRNGSAGSGATGFQPPVVGQPRLGGGGHPDQPGRSGRGLVIIALLSLGALVVLLLILFRYWRSERNELLAYGRDRVATAIDPLSKSVPGSMSPEEWSLVIDQVHALLEDLTASGALDLPQMRNLRRDVQEQINGARPDTAAQALSQLWDRLEDQSGPLITARARFGPASTVRPLSTLNPADIDPAQWALAVVETRAMLAALGAPAPLLAGPRQVLENEIRNQLAESTPARARADLLAIWKIVAKNHPLPAGFSQSVLEARPEGESNAEPVTGEPQ